MIPMLVHIWALSYPLALACTLAQLVGMSFSGVVKHTQLGHVHWPMALTFSVGAVPAAMASRQLLYVMEARWGDEPAFSMGFDVAFAVVIVFAVLTTLWRRRRSRMEGSGDEVDAVPARHKLLLTGVASGLTTGMLGLGGGVVAVPVLYGLLRQPLRRAVSTSIVQMLLSGFAATMVTLMVGTIDFRIVALLLLGSAPGAWLGPKLLARLTREKAVANAEHG